MLVYLDVQFRRHDTGQKDFIALNTDTLLTAETSVYFKETTPSSIPEGFHRQ
jgi:hypothetical protein